jgi:dipeptidyl aminopeptidase/acylaminoacyl peptidase
MRRPRPLCKHLCHGLLCLIVMGRSLNTLAVEEKPSPISVADCIGMAHVSGVRGYLEEPSDSIAYFSPDASRFAVVTAKGNLNSNTTDYSLLVWQTNDVFRSVTPQVLFTLSSSSSNGGAAIQDLTWVNNSRIEFLGQQSGEVRQLYTYDLDTSEMKRVTAHHTSVSAYATDVKGDVVVFTAEEVIAKNLDADDIQRSGYRVTTELLPDLISGHIGNPYAVKLFVERNTGQTAEIKIEGGRLYTANKLSLSPDGQYLVVDAYATDIPNSWRGYTDTAMQELMTRRYDVGAYVPFRRLMLVDLNTGRSTALVDAPVGDSGYEAAWSSDGRSIIVTDVYLPLDDASAAERSVRQASTFTAEVTIPGREIAKVSNKELTLGRWDRTAGALEMYTGRPGSLALHERKRICFKKKGANWQQTVESCSDKESSVPEISLVEGLNLTPRIISRDIRTGQRSELLNLNPQFRDRIFGKEEEIKWQAADGHEVTGGLYFPVGYVPGKRYPLVIQTHGFCAGCFWIDGPYSATFAAQPLAGRGIVVLQVQEPSLVTNDPDFDSPREPRAAMAAYEGAIDYLSGLGLIDRRRVGIAGFSRSSFYVKYTITHSRYKFEAASVTDGVDEGYFQYIAFSNAEPSLASESERINGGRPFGNGLVSWLRDSPSSTMDRVQTPVLIEALGPYSLVQEWEWFSGLRLLGKPVDLLYIPSGLHLLARPWERRTSMQTNVDWFCFWLGGEKDQDPYDLDNYHNWQRLPTREDATKTADALP